MWNPRALISLSLMTCLWVGEVLSEGGRSRRGAEGQRGLVWGRASADGPVCWGPGVWPHPENCRMFSVCHMTPDTGIKGILLLCPPKMAFSTRRGRCFVDRTRCSQRPLPSEFMNSTDVYELQTVNQRNYRCKTPRPYCSTETILTVCAPNFNLIGNVTCAGTCKQDGGGASCILTTETDAHVTEEITVFDPTSTITPETTTSMKTTRFISTTEKYELPVLDADLIDSAMKITSALGLNPNTQGQQMASDTHSDSSKPSKHEVKPSPPAYTSPVFDFNSSPEEDSYETGQSEEDEKKPPFSKPVVVEASQIPITKRPPVKDNEESQVFTVEMIRPVAGHRPQGSVGNNEKHPVLLSSSTSEKPAPHQQAEGTISGLGEGVSIKVEEERIKLEEEKKKLEMEKQEKEKLEKERIEMERLEKERLEKERLEKERLEKERLEKERINKERIEKERIEKERLEKERIEKERLEKERIDKERIEKERLEKEKREKERLEKERLEKERVEKERVEKERVEKERLEKERLEKERLEKERLEKERLEKERLEKERLEKERLEKERLEKERLDKEKLERERLEKEKLQKEKNEREKLEKEKLESEKLEKEKQEKERLEEERLEKLEKERLEKEKFNLEKLEREKLEKEKAEKEKVEKEELEREKLNKEREEQQKLEIEKWEKENEKYTQEYETTLAAEPSEEGTQLDESSYLSTVCSRPGLLCANSKTLIECSSDLIPLRAWDCGSFFSRSATLMAKCDPEKDSCVATVEESWLPTDGELETESASRLCKRPGAQCADSATLIHCSDDLRSATIAVCVDLFPRDAVGATCDSTLEACVVGLGEGEEYYGGVEMSHTTPTLPTSFQAPTLLSTSRPTTQTPPRRHTSKPTLTTTAVARPTKTSTTGDMRNQSTTQPSVSMFATTPPSVNLTDKNVTHFPELRNPCSRPGLRCSGGKILEACEKDNPKPVYKMDCSSVLANSLNARCEKHSAGEATCMVLLRRSTSQVREGEKYGQISPEDDVFTLELSVVDVTKTFDASDEEMPSWNCSRAGQYCADDSTLISCNPDFSLEFALSCGAIAPELVLAFCDYQKNACVVKKISEITSDFPEKDPSSVNSSLNVTNEKNVANNQSYNSDPEAIPSSVEWDYSTISQLYPPDVHINAYGGNTKPSQGEHPTDEYHVPQAADSFDQGYLTKCSKPGPICLDGSHLGSCTKDLDLQYVLPCSAIYSGDPAALCDPQLSACLPSSSKPITTTAAPTTTTTTTTATSTTTRPPRPETPSNVFVPQQIPSYPQYPYMLPPSNLPQAPMIQSNQFPQVYPGAIQQPTLNQYPRPGLFQFFQRPFANNQPSQQQTRLPSFLQNILQNYGIKLPSFPQNPRPGLFGSQGIRPPTLGSYPILSSIFQGGGNANPNQGVNQNARPEDLGEESYNFEDPQYVHPGGLTSKDNVPYHSLSFIHKQAQEIEKAPVPMINPNLYREILKYTLQTTPSQQDAFSVPQDYRPVSESSQDSYFDRFLSYLAQRAPAPGSAVKGNTPSSTNTRPNQKYRPSEGNQNIHQSVYRPGAVSQEKPVQANIQAQGSISQVNPLTWVDKVQFEEVKKSAACKRPGMQCVDLNSLGACSEELELQYVIPCRNLLPFVTVGKAFCDEENDACGVMTVDERPEYPTDYTSYP